MVSACSRKRSAKPLDCYKDPLAYSILSPVRSTFIDYSHNTSNTSSPHIYENVLQASPRCHRCFRGPCFCVVCPLSFNVSLGSHISGGAMTVNALLAPKRAVIPSRTPTPLRHWGLWPPLVFSWGPSCPLA